MYKEGGMSAGGVQRVSGRTHKKLVKVAMGGARLKKQARKNHLHGVPESLDSVSWRFKDKSEM